MECTIYLAGSGDEGFDFRDSRFQSAAEMTAHLASLGKPQWIRLGHLSVYSQNIIAIETGVTE